MDWSQIDKNALEKLFYDDGMSDKEIAGLFQISKGKVQYKRQKYGITVEKKLIRRFKMENEGFFSKLNADARMRLCRNENIDSIAKAIVHYSFRNGPVEDMHAEGKLSQQDMKILNKFMVDRIAGILESLAAGDWLKLELLYGFYQLYGTDWDVAEPDREEIELIFEQTMADVLLK